MFIFQTKDGNVVENVILNDIILFSYFVILMMLWVDMLLRSYVIIEPHYVLEDGTANFITYFIVMLL